MTVTENANDTESVLAPKKHSFMTKLLMNCVTKLLNMPDYLSGPNFPGTKQNTIVIW